MQVAILTRSHPLSPNVSGDITISGDILIIIIAAFCVELFLDIVVLIKQFLQNANCGCGEGRRRLIIQSPVQFSQQVIFPACSEFGWQPHWRWLLLFFLYETLWKLDSNVSIFWVGLLAVIFIFGRGLGKPDLGLLPCSSSTTSKSIPYTNIIIVFLSILLLLVPIIVLFSAPTQFLSRLLKLALQSHVLLAQTLYNNLFLVLVVDGRILDAVGLQSIVKSLDSLFEISIRGTDASYHQAIGVASKWLL